MTRHPLTHAMPAPSCRLGPSVASLATVPLLPTAPPHRSSPPLRPAALPAALPAGEPSLSLSGADLDLEGDLEFEEDEPQEEPRATEAGQDEGEGARGGGGARVRSCSPSEAPRRAACRPLRVLPRASPPDGLPASPPSFRRAEELQLPSPLHSDSGSLGSPQRPAFSPPGASKLGAGACAAIEAACAVALRVALCSSSACKGLAGLPSVEVSGEAGGAPALQAVDMCAVRAAADSERPSSRAAEGSDDEEDDEEEEGGAGARGGVGLTSDEDLG
jgi:hypothetical protein